MTMFVQLLVITCACALGTADEVPDYKNIGNMILMAEKILHDNILTMDGNVPVLTDARRHYAEIIHVIHSEANSENSCLGHDYYGDYQTNINASAPNAIENPQAVVDGTKKVIHDILSSINKVLDLIDGTIQKGVQDVNTVIDAEIKKNDDKAGWSQDVFLAAGIAASELFNNHENFAAVSKDLSAHNFVIKGAHNLELTVMAVTNLYKLVYGNHPTC